MTVSTPQRAKPVPMWSPKVAGGDTNANMQFPPYASSPGSSASSTPSTSVANVYDAMERENEAIVNRLQREIQTLKLELPRSRSQSQSSTHSTASSFKMKPELRSSHRRSHGEEDAPLGLSTTDQLRQLRREKEVLSLKVAELKLRLVDKDRELISLRRKLSGHERPGV